MGVLTVRFSLIILNDSKIQLLNDLWRYIDMVQDRANFLLMNDTKEQICRAAAGRISRCHPRGCRV